MVEEVITDPLLAKVLVGNLPLYAAERDKTPFSTHAFIMDFYNQSAYRFVGGSDSVAKSMVATIEKYGGTVKRNVKVTQIVCDEARAIGVNTDKDVLLSALTLETLPTVSDDFAALKNNTKISDISLTNDTYRAQVVGNTDHSMLCVPILFTGRWSATVNGKPVQVLNINGGLCGIPLEEGENDVVMTYTLPFFGISVIISLVTATLLLSVLIIWRVRRK